MIASSVVTAIADVNGTVVPPANELSAWYEPQVSWGDVALSVEPTVHKVGGVVELQVIPLPAANMYGNSWLVSVAFVDTACDSVSTQEPPAEARSPDGGARSAGVARSLPGGAARSGGEARSEGEEGD